MDYFLRKMRLLKGIVPDADFALSSKMTILSQPQDVRQSVKLVKPEIWAGFAVMATVICLVFFLGNIKAPNVAVSVSDIALLEQDALSFENDINIALKEIHSYKDSAQKTALALHEASSNDPAHINASLIGKELEKLDIDIPEPSEADRLLERAIF